MTQIVEQEKDWLEELLDKVFERINSGKVESSPYKGGFNDILDAASASKRLLRAAIRNGDTDQIIDILVNRYTIMKRRDMQMLIITYMGDMVAQGISENDTDLLIGTDESEDYNEDDLEDEEP
jgi:hypothetical protein